VPLPEAPLRALVIIGRSLPDPVPPVDHELVQQAPIFVLQCQFRHFCSSPAFSLLASNRARTVLYARCMLLILAQRHHCDERRFKSKCDKC
jgi:hypothetical protein